MLNGERKMSVYEQMNEQTEKKIEKTFLALMEEKDFSKISVRDITTNSAINRGTFYIHYADKYELLEKIEFRVLNGLEQASLQLQPEQVLKEAKAGELSPFSIQVFQFIAQHRQEFKVLLSVHNQSGFMKRLQHFFIEQFTKKYENHELVLVDHAFPIRYFAGFAASAFLGVIEQWLTSEEEETPEQIANYFVRIILSIQKFNDRILF